MRRLLFPHEQRHQRVDREVRRAAQIDDCPLALFHSRARPRQLTSDLMRNRDDAVHVGVNEITVLDPQPTDLDLAAALTMCT